jgi:hypothetical protein
MDAVRITEARYRRQAKAGLGLPADPPFAVTAARASTFEGGASRWLGTPGASLGDTPYGPCRRTAKAALARRQRRGGEPATPNP